MLFSYSVAHCVPMYRTLPPPPFMGRWSGRKPLDQSQWQWRREKTWSSTKLWNGDAGNRGRWLLQWCVDAHFL